MRTFNLKPALIFRILALPRGFRNDLSTHNGGGLLADHRMRSLVLVIVTCSTRSLAEPVLCTNTCNYDADGDCDDGGVGSNYDACSYGTDCADCDGRRPDFDSCTYDWTQNAALSGYNHRTLLDVSVEDCKVACCQTEWCVTFDYHKNTNKCDLSRTRAEDVGGLSTNYPGNPYDHYSLALPPSPPTAPPPRSQPPCTPASSSARAPTGSDARW